MNNDKLSILKSAVATIDPWLHYLFTDFLSKSDIDFFRQTATDKLDTDFVKAGSGGSENRHKYQFGRTGTSSPPDDLIMLFTNKDVFNFLVPGYNNRQLPDSMLFFTLTLCYDALPFKIEVHTDQDYYKILTLIVGIDENTVGTEIYDKNKQYVKTITMSPGAGYYFGVTSESYHAVGVQNEITQPRLQLILNYFLMPKSQYLAKQYLSTAKHTIIGIPVVL